MPQTLLIFSVEDLLSGNREISQWAQFIDRVVDTRSTETVTHTANCGNTEEISQVQCFDKVDMAFAVRDQSRQRRTLLMFRVFCFLIERMIGIATLRIRIRPRRPLVSGARRIGRAIRPTCAIAVVQDLETHYAEMTRVGVRLVADFPSRAS